MKAYNIRNGKKREIKIYKEKNINGITFIETRKGIYKKINKGFMNLADLKIRIKNPTQRGNGTWRDDKFDNFDYYEKLSKNEYNCNKIEITKELEIKTNIFDLIGQNIGYYVMYLQKNNNNYVLNIIMARNTNKQLRQGVTAVYDENFNFIDSNNFVDSYKNISWHEVVSKVYRIKGFKTLDFTEIITEILEPLKKTIRINQEVAK